MVMLKVFRVRNGRFRVPIPGTWFNHGDVEGFPSSEWKVSSPDTRNHGDVEGFSSSEWKVSTTSTACNRTKKTAIQYQISNRFDGAPTSNVALL
jgi:hypothetical protein